MTAVSLRTWQRQDAQQLAAIANNKNVWNYVRNRLPNPYTVTDALQWIAHCQTQKPTENFAIVYNGSIAGSIGCTPKEDVYKKTIEIGYFVGEEFWGKGIATEALKQLLQYIPQHFSIIRIYAETFSYNKASMKVLQKNNFYLEAIHRNAVVKNHSLCDAYIWAKFL
jgi:RimJ/RimL family protein N-acetyltransferase